MIDRLDRPYANHAAHVTLRPQTRVGSGGERVQAKPQVRVTVQGLSYLHKRLGGVSPIDFSQVAS
jgi:anti-repressor protein